MKRNILNIVGLFRMLGFCLCWTAIMSACQDKTDDTAFEVPTPDLSFTESKLTLPLEEKEYTVGVESNLPWRVKSSASWIELKTSNGMGTGDFTISVTKNTEITERQAEIIAWIVEGQEKSIKVVQAGMGIVLKKHSLSMGVEENQFKIPFSTLVDYTCETEDTWIHIIDKPAFASGSINELELEIKVDAYDSEDPRTGYVYVTGTNGTIEILAITQDKKASVDSDRTCLTEFFENANGANWTKKWNVEAPMETNATDWPGVKFENGKVVEIDIQTPNNIIGDITSLCGLTELRVLKFKNQKITGIPEEIGQLTKLVHLWIYESAASGRLPQSLGECKMLSTFNISNHPTATAAGFENSFSGNMDMLVKIPGMVTIKAYCNNLSGSLPVIPLDNNNQPTTWKSLKEFMVYTNSFSGSIPYGYGIVIEKSGSSGIFRVNDNQLSGQIPADIKAWSQYSSRKAAWILAGNSLTE